MRSTHKDGTERKNLSLPPVLSLVGSQYNLQIPAAENTHKISIPHSNGIFDADFPHEKTIHPPKSKLHELDAFRLQVGRKRSFRAEEP